MIAKVIRNGQHSGGDHFVEVQETPSSPHYAVPVSDEIPIGSDVEIVVTLKAAPKEPEPVVEDQVVSPESAEAFAVETSPIAEVEAPVTEPEPVAEEAPVEAPVEEVHESKKKKGK